MNSKKGTIYAVATPIGNLGDFSHRACQILSQASLILAEDTRNAKRLLHHYQIDVQTRSFHEYNEDQQIAYVLGVLYQGKDVALISDAGTPLISDPGYKLIRAARIEGVNVIPIPGASALTAALSVSGLPTDRFCFEGFLPSKSAARRQKLKDLRTENRTIVIYESSHRIIQSLEDIKAEFPKSVEIMVAREMTKKFESYYFGGVETVLNQISQNRDNQKGEFVIIIKHSVDQNEIRYMAQKLTTALLEYLSPRQASKIAAETFNVGKNELYGFAIKQKNSN